MLSQLRSAAVLFLLLTLVTGVVYPLAITGIAQVAFPDQANGSLVKRADGTVIGSSLIGQDFSAGEPVQAARFFWGRLSATAPVPYTAFNAERLTGSSGSNYAPTNPALIDAAKARLDALHAADAAVGVKRSAEERVPVDLVTASGSGLDPHISLAAAEYQLPRVAIARKLDPSVVRELVRLNTQERTFGLLGEPVVNVLTLNLALDAGAVTTPPVK